MYWDTVKQICGFPHLFHTRIYVEVPSVNLMDATPLCDIIKIYTYTGCPRRNVKYFGRVFLESNYTDITQNTYIQS